MFFEEETTDTSVSEEVKEPGTTKEEFAPKTDDDSETSEPIAEETKKEETAEGKEEGDTSSALEEVATSEDDDGSDDDLLSEFDDTKPDKKDGMQKRIDKLTARLRNAEEKLGKVEKTKESGDKPTYTRSQLTQAMRKAFEDQDPALVMDIVDYAVTQAKDDLRKEYTDEQKSVADRANKTRQEWSSIVEDYAYLSSPDEPEIYPGSRKDLNIVNQNSLVYKLAAQLYNHPDASVSGKYRKEGGQRAVIVDAIARILKKKRLDTSEIKSSKTLEKKLAKQKRKSSLTSGKSVKAAIGTAKPKTAIQDLSDYIEERKKFQEAKQR